MTAYTSFHLSLLDKIIVVANTCKRRLRYLYNIDADKISVVYNGIDPMRLVSDKTRSAMRDALGVGFGVKVISMIGRLVPQKGYRYAFRAIRELLKYRDDFVVHIAGVGRELPMLDEYAIELGIRDKIKFLAYREDVPDLLQATDIFLNTSIHEGLPYTVQEAMFWGVPVVASPVDGTPEAVADGRTGFLVEYDDPLGIALRLKTLMEHPEICFSMGQAAMTRAHDMFTISEMIDKTEGIYRQRRHVRDSVPDSLPVSG